MKASALTLILLLAFGAVAVAQQDVMKPTDVGADDVGKSVAVEGRVYSNVKTSGGIHLYFGPDTTTCFEAIIPADSVPNFKVDITKKYTKRNVRVTGDVEEASGKFFIRVKESKQIKVVARKRGTS